MGVWLLLSVTLHLFVEKDIRLTRRAIHPKAANPAELFMCWEATYRLFDDLVYDFGNELLLTRKHRRDLKGTWGDRYGWDLVPWDQHAPDRLSRELVGRWRWQRYQVWGWCRLGEPEVVERSAVLTLLKEVHADLDRLRVSLTRRIRSFVEPGRLTVGGGDLELIDSIRIRLRRAEKAAVAKTGRGRKTRDLKKLRRWKLKRSKP